MGLDTPDDAAVYRLDDERALIVTTDFFTPIVDDPYQYGAIAAANALSDVYAMGGMPLLALNIAALPPNLPTAMSAAIMRGAAEKVCEAGAVIAGGHTIRDNEPKVGLAVVGMAHPDRLLTKSGARPGDILALTKPLGMGVITTAFKSDKADLAHLAEATDWMVQLNRAAAEAAVAVGAHAATDITGFSLLGHAAEVAEASDVTLRIAFERLPFLSGARSYAEQWIFPGGAADNALAFERHVRFADAVGEAKKMLLFDPQTSGGLLIAVPPSQVEGFSHEMDMRGAAWWQVGKAVAREDVGIVIT